jgi:hypothetical protein
VKTKIAWYTDGVYLLGKKFISAMKIRHKFCYRPVNEVT